MFHVIVATAGMTLLAAIVAAHSFEKSKLKYWPDWHWRYARLNRATHDQLCYLIGTVLFVEAVYWLMRWMVSLWS